MLEIECWGIYVGAAWCIICWGIGVAQARERSVLDEFNCGFFVLSAPIWIPLFWAAYLVGYLATVGVDR